MNLGEYKAGCAQRLFQKKKRANSDFATGLENNFFFLNRFTPNRIDILTFLFLRSSVLLSFRNRLIPVNNVIFFTFSLPIIIIIIIIIIKYSVFFTQKERKQQHRKSGILTRCA